MVGNDYCPGLYKMSWQRIVEDPDLINICHGSINHIPRELDKIRWFDQHTGWRHGDQQRVKGGLVWRIGRSISTSLGKDRRVFDTTAPYADGNHPSFAGRQPPLTQQARRQLPDDDGWTQIKGNLLRNHRPVCHKSSKNSTIVQSFGRFAPLPVQPVAEDEAEDVQRQELISSKATSRRAARAYPSPANARERGEVMAPSFILAPHVETRGPSQQASKAAQNAREARAETALNRVAAVRGGVANAVKKAVEGDEAAGDDDDDDDNDDNDDAGAKQQKRKYKSRANVANRLYGYEYTPVFDTPVFNVHDRDFFVNNNVQNVYQPVNCSLPTGSCLDPHLPLYQLVHLAIVWTARSVSIVLQDYFETMPLDTNHCDRLDKGEFVDLWFAVRDALMKGRRWNEIEQADREARTRGAVVDPLPPSWKWDQRRGPAIPGDEEQYRREIAPIKQRLNALRKFDLHLYRVMERLVPTESLPAFAFGYDAIFFRKVASQLWTNLMVSSKELLVNDLEKVVTLIQLDKPVTLLGEDAQSAMFTDPRHRALVRRVGKNLKDVVKAILLQSQFTNNVTWSLNEQDASDIDAVLNVPSLNLFDNNVKISLSQRVKNIAIALLNERNAASGLASGTIRKKLGSSPLTLLSLSRWAKRRAGRKFVPSHKPRFARLSAKAIGLLVVQGIKIATDLVAAFNEQMLPLLRDPQFVDNKEVKHAATALSKIQVLRHAVDGRGAGLFAPTCQDAMELDASWERRMARARDLACQYLGIDVNKSGGYNVFADLHLVTADYLFDLRALPNDRLPTLSVQFDGLLLYHLTVDVSSAFVTEKIKGEFSIDETSLNAHPRTLFEQVVRHHTTAWYNHDKALAVFSRVPNLVAYARDRSRMLVGPRQITRSFDPTLTAASINWVNDKHCDRLLSLPLNFGGRRGPHQRRRTVIRLVHHPATRNKTRNGLPVWLRSVHNDTTAILETILKSSNLAEASITSKQAAFENSRLITIDVGLNNAVGVSIITFDRQDQRVRRDLVLSSKGLAALSQEEAKRSKSAQERFANASQAQTPQLLEFAEHSRSLNRQQRRRQILHNRAMNRIKQRFVDEVCAAVGIFATSPTGKATRDAADMTPKAVSWGNLSSVDQRATLLLIGGGFTGKQGGGHNVAYGHPIVHSLVQRLTSLSSSFGFNFHASLCSEHRSSRMCPQQSCVGESGLRSWVQHCTTMPDASKAWSVLQCERCNKVYQRDRMACSNILFIAWHQIMFGRHPFLTEKQHRQGIDRGMQDDDE
ncbi:hypothetical protein OIO90_006053 [Microbotryomycetes sp. JL221]|nr:hypothetical protein OIO90_006053 [Microbotryomycetes sp. JL221]